MHRDGGHRETGSTDGCNIILLVSEQNQTVYASRRLEVVSGAIRRTLAVGFHLTSELVGIAGNELPAQVTTVA